MVVRHVLLACSTGGYSSPRHAGCSSLLPLALLLVSGGGGPELGGGLGDTATAARAAFARLACSMSLQHD
jgi:hypothetical protein